MRLIENCSGVSIVLRSVVGGNSVESVVVENFPFLHILVRASGERRRRRGIGLVGDGFGFVSLLSASKAVPAVVVAMLVALRGLLGVVVVGGRATVLLRFLGVTGHGDSDARATISRVTTFVFLFHEETLRLCEFCGI